MTEAPEHFAFSEHSCYVCKQPQTPLEFDRMIGAMEVQELDCIRYRGTAREVQVRLVAMGAANNCDQLLPGISSSAKKRTPVMKHWVSALWRRIRR